VISSVISADLRGSRLSIAVMSYYFTPFSSNYFTHRILSFTLDAGFRVLDSGYWILDTGFWILDTGFWILDSGFDSYDKHPATSDQPQQPATSIHTPPPMSYKNLEIWQEARILSIRIHEMSLSLPRFEQFEEAQQIRRSSKSVRSNIVEGYGRRRYKQDFIRFLVIAQASNDETIDHLETLFETKSLTDKIAYDDLHNRLQQLGRKINNFIRAVEKDHNTTPTTHEPEAEYFNPDTDIQ
jgi:four helix bundle protein